MARNKIRSEIWEGEDVPTRARVILDTGSALTSADVTSYDVRVFALSLGATSTPSTYIYYTSSGVPSTAVYDAYRTSGWTQDSTGYNVEFILRQTDIQTSAYMRGGNTYRIILDLLTANYGHIHVVHDVNVRSHMGA